jgi:hypothetical protein
VAEQNAAELLRRAAKTLREHLGGLEERLRGEWQMSCVHPFMDGKVQFRIGPVPHGPKVLDGVLPGGLPPYIALMHPPVALALADLLAETAETLDEVPDEDLAAEMFAEAITLARAILREPAGRAVLDGRKA